jgi:hypothetical protein
LTENLKNSSEYIYIDGRGDWWYEGSKIIHPEILKLFKSSLRIDPETGGLRIDYKGRQAPVRVEKTPFFVQDIAPAKDAEGGLSVIELLLDDDSREPLDPETLIIDSDGVLTVRVKGGCFAALCLPTAHFRLAELFEEDGQGGFSLTVAGRRYPVTVEENGVDL